jgi:glycosyltransferase involved in cell wall biosynthesis
MTDTSTSHLVLIPSYNTGPVLLSTVREARKYWSPVWVVIDGSTDGSEIELSRMAEHDSGLHVFVLERNQGKGAAVLHGLREATRAGFTHVLTMDSDGQHPPE